MRKAGVLMPISSLPSPYGIGTLGKAAFDFVDFLSCAGQSLWQVLPCGPTGYGDSPYQSFSSFAGNPYFIDLDILHSNGLLLAADLEGPWGEDPAKVDYGLLFNRRFTILAKAVSRQNKTSPEYLDFCQKNQSWLDDYALFMAIKESYGHVSFQRWPQPLRLRRPAAIKAATVRFAPRVEYWRCLQFFFFTQWTALKSYANSQGIQLVGDLPIYVSPDSSDLWANPQLFQLDHAGRPMAVAGVPPDAFSQDGQLWGNPLYNWPYHKKTRYNWWMQRLRFADKMYDITRIDHFRGFANYYSIPAGAKTAKPGHWEPGPGKSFIKTLRKTLPHMNIIAEDLGELSPEVHHLLAYSGYPGMKILQFAFDSSGTSNYLPHCYSRNTVVYTGTHDNTTTEDWLSTTDPASVAFARKYLGLTPSQSLTEGMIRAAYASVADTVIIPAPDWLRLGAEARINAPSTLGGINWQWRALEGQLSEKLAHKIREKCKLYSRLSSMAKCKEKKSTPQTPRQKPDKA